MPAAFSKVYRSFEEFEREELRKLNTLHVSIDEMFDDWFIEELDLDEESVSKSRRKDDKEDDWG